MSQSNAIAGAVAIAFLVFITLRGELPSYLGLFKPKAQAPSTTASGGSSGGSDIGSIIGAVKAGKGLYDFLSNSSQGNSTQTDNSNDPVSI